MKGRNELSVLFSATFLRNSVLILRINRN